MEYLKFSKWEMNFLPSGFYLKGVGSGVCFQRLNNLNYSNEKCKQ